MTWRCRSGKDGGARRGSYCCDCGPLKPWGKKENPNPVTSRPTGPLRHLHFNPFITLRHLCEPMADTTSLSLWLASVGSSDCSRASPLRGRG